MNPWVPVTVALGVAFGCLGWISSERHVSKTECEARGYAEGEFTDGRIKCWHVEKVVAHDD